MSTLSPSEETYIINIYVTVYNASFVRGVCLCAIIQKGTHYMFTPFISEAVCIVKAYNASFCAWRVDMCDT
jgi:hypothetical protein